MPLDSAKPRCNPCNRYKRKKQRPEQGYTAPAESQPSGSSIFPHSGRKYFYLYDYFVPKSLSPQSPIPGTM